MAKKFLTQIDMNGLEIRNFVVHNLASDPTGTDGMLYYNTGSDTLRYYNGTAWVTLDQGTTIPKTSTTPKMDGTAAIGSETAYAAGDHVHPTDTSRAPTSHASSATTYGTGTQSNYGHVKLYDQESDSYGVSNGIAATPKALYNVLNSAIDYTDQVVEDVLGDAAKKDVDTSISSGSSSTNLPTSAAVATFVSNQIGAVDAMRFKGTIGTGGTVTTLPTSGVKVGDTYRVITAGTYAGQTCEVGDLIIATATTPTWTVAQTNIDGAITTAGTGLSKSGTTLNHSNSVTAKTTQALYPIAFDAQGHITGAGTAITNATTSTAGLMSASDKDALDTLTSSGLTACAIARFTPTSSNLTLRISSVVVSYTAYDATTGDEVIVDYNYSGSGTTFSVASAYPNGIQILYTYEIG